MTLEEKIANIVFRNKAGTLTREEISTLNDEAVSQAIFHKIARPACGSCATDLNHCQNIEAILTPEQWEKYIVHLDAIKENNRNAAETAVNIFTGHFPFLSRACLFGIIYGLCFTTRQRAEALLWVLTQPESAKS
jgi:hypothetical protein